MMFQKSIFANALVGLLVVMPLLDHQSLSAAQTVDNAIYADLLSKYVINGKVDYNGMKSEEGVLDTYLKHLSSIAPDQLSRDERFAFYINAYNAWTLKLILSHYPGINSIKETGGLLSSPWKKKIAHIDGRVITLDHIEHDILRPQFKDPRVHFAINCAARSCPPLADFAFSGAELDRQLDLQTRTFINTPAGNYLEGDTLWVSRIFKWFGEDFGNDILTFFTTYAEGDLKRALNSKKDRITVKYLDYDWSLNKK